MHAGTVREHQPLTGDERELYSALDDAGVHFVVHRLAPPWGIHVVIAPDEAKAADDAGAGKADDVTSTLAGGEAGPRKGGGSAKGAQRETKAGAGRDATAVAVDDVVDTPVGIMPDYLEATGDEGEVDVTGMAPAHGDDQAASRGRVPPMDVVSVTFGSPRVGNHLFASQYNDAVVHTWRIVFEGDFITGIPKLLWVYKHLGIEVRGARSCCVQCAVGVWEWCAERTCCWQVEIDRHGNMVVDPSFVEKQFRVSSRRRFASHSMYAYRCGALCVTGECGRVSLVLTQCGCPGVVYQGRLDCMSQAARTSDGTATPTPRQRRDRLFPIRTPSALEYHGGQWTCWHVRRQGFKPTHSGGGWCGTREVGRSHE